jgi:hypothetical protein
MRRPLFGELLSQVVKLSDYDVSEILEEQFITPRRFGQIALAFGLCKPQDIWKAWWEQISDPPLRVDLAAIGIDSQSLSAIPREMARGFGVIPLRSLGGQLVIAASEEVIAAARRDLPDRLKYQLKFVLADARQIAQTIELIYPVMVPPAAA